MFELEDCVAFITSKTAKHLSQAFDKRLKSEGGISRSLWVALYFIDKSGSLTQSELADKMAVKEPSIVGLISSLANEGLIFKASVESDKRTKKIQLTEKGKLLLIKTEPIANKFKSDAVSGLSENQLETYSLVLEKMKSNIS